ncbi:hypothetical protein [Mycobacteroides abscessus]|uniref:hypothetical protein n=1 Tax=Mycobacteroides abscessus TaxID=36809 RepID=UPI001051D329|nr:hypothetical protein [Mycobacteroides abscessus]
MPARSHYLGESLCRGAGIDGDSPNKPMACDTEASEGTSRQANDYLDGISMVVADSRNYRGAW